MSRAQTQVSVIGGAELTEEELLVLSSTRGIAAPEIKRVRQTHHTLARLLALGMADGEAAAAVGLSPSRVSILKSDPTFQSLLAVYHQNQDAIVLDIMKKVQEVGSLALEEVRDRLLEEPEKVTNSQLLEIATAALDRLGHGPTQKVAIAHVDINSIKERAAAARRDQITFRQEFTMDRDRELSLEAQEIDQNPTNGPDL